MTSSDTSRLFSPLRVGALEIPNRIVMAPLTRIRSTGDGKPSPFAAKYYAQRATAGLIVGEATHVSPLGYPSTPGIYSPEQVKG